MWYTILFIFYCLFLLAVIAICKAASDEHKPKK